MLQTSRHHQISGMIRPAPQLQQVIASIGPEHFMIWKDADQLIITVFILRQAINGAALATPCFELFFREKIILSFFPGKIIHPLIQFAKISDQRRSNFIIGGDPVNDGFVLIQFMTGRNQLLYGLGRGIGGLVRSYKCRK